MSETKPSPNVWLTPTDVAERLKTSAETVRRMMHTPGGPPFIKFSTRTYRIRETALAAWAATREKLQMAAMVRKAQDQDEARIAAAGAEAPDWFEQLSREHGS